MSFLKRNALKLFFAGSIIVTLVIVTVVSLTSSPEKGVSEGPTAPQVTESSTSAPSSSSSPVPGGDEQEVTPTKDCTTLMQANEYSTLVSRIQRYEELRLEQPSSSQQSELVSLSTSNYRATHKEEVPASSGNTVIVELNKVQSSITCKVVSDTRVIVLANPIVISTYEVEVSTGQKTLLNANFAVPSHYTGWVQQNAGWYVDSEN